ncbi:hypothetical protein DSO57_1026936 [Entomophthora muscae]|uniref:Uncharacterized protein n=1 Tax=Entomophthora muscae TaxID=34485 RepID=A0ACC2SF53_9FUNG|nr:hypothetical protein DSO57_1026936 [Entomophthora muscae]
MVWFSCSGWLSGLRNLARIKLLRSFIEASRAELDIQERSGSVVRSGWARTEGWGSRSMAGLGLIVASDVKPSILFEFTYRG